MRIRSVPDESSLSYRLAVVEHFSDFLSEGADGVGTGGSSGSNSMSGTLAVPGRPGVLTMTMSSSINNRRQFMLSPSTIAAALALGGGVLTFETELYFVTLPNAASQARVTVGLGNVINAEPTNGVYFGLDWSIDTGGTWLLCTADNGTRTRTVSAAAAVAGAWTRFKIVVNAAGTSAEFFINGVSVGTVATNVPIANGRTVSPLGVSTNLAAVAVALVWAVDWIYTRIELATGR